MAVIDADAHVIEYDHTWDYMDESQARHRPFRVAEISASGEGREFLIIDGQLQPAGRQPGQRDPSSVQPQFANLGDRVELNDASRFPVDVQSRIRHMDELGTDVQVLYPTLFISPFTNKPEVELAMSQSYNRWLADLWSQGQGRLRWAAVLPLRKMDKALEEVNWAKEHGACAVFMRGIECGNKLLGDSYFFPLYQEASRLNLPVCVHTGNSSEELSTLFAQETGFSRFKLVGVGAFHNIIFSGIPDRFPDLRFGFIELSSQWVPYAISDLDRRFVRQGKAIKSNVLRDNRIYVTCQNNDDLSYVIDCVGDDNLVIGTDYGHADTSTEIHALQTFRDMETISSSARTKILGDNARALYGL